MVPKPITINFFGTQEFARTILAGFLGNKNFLVQAVVTQPDRPVGRKHILTPSPVKILAEANKVPVFQPESLKDFIISKEIDTVPDLHIVAQYGLMIPESIVVAPQFGTINVHTSLLPKYRGASPIQSALMNGESETGITIMLMDKGMDTGPILSQQKIAINPADTYESLDKKMAELGTELLLKTIPPYLQGKIKPQPQDDAQATSCKKLDRDTGRVNWGEHATTIYNFYRGLYPWPGIWTTWNNQRVKLLSVQPTAEIIAPGHLKTNKKSVLVGCHNSALEILALQIEGKNAQSAESFIAGYAPNNQNFI